MAVQEEEGSAIEVGCQVRLAVQVVVWIPEGAAAAVDYVAADVVLDLVVVDSVDVVAAGVVVALVVDVTDAVDVLVAGAVVVPVVDVIDYVAVTADVVVVPPVVDAIDSVADVAAVVATYSAVANVAFVKTESVVLATFHSGSFALDGDFVDQKGLVIVALQLDEGTLVAEGFFEELLHRGHFVATGWQVGLEK